MTYVFNLYESDCGVYPDRVETLENPLVDDILVVLRDMLPKGRVSCFVTLNDGSLGFHHSDIVEALSKALFIEGGK